MEKKKEEILAELKEKFEEAKQKLGFKATYEEINEAFYLEDAILARKYVSQAFSRQLMSRIVEDYYSSVGILHSWIFPNPSDLIYSGENKKLSSEEKKEITDAISKIMYFVRKGKRLEIENSDEIGPFIDEMCQFYRENFKAFLIKYNLKFEKMWVGD